MVLIWRATVPRAFSCSSRLQLFKCFSSSAAPPAFERVGFIGLGHMGSPMANNLMKAGYQLVVHDRNESVENIFAERGAMKASTPFEVAKESDVVITMLPSVATVIEVYLGCSGLLSKDTSLRSLLLIDSSTVDPHTSRKIAAEVKQCKLENSWYSKSFEYPMMIDAPVSGGVPGAQAGSLTFMVGGPEKGCELAQPLFQAMGKSVIHCGGAGNGAAAKVCNNLALGVSMAGISEALALGQKLGIDAQTLSVIFNTSSARCWSSDTYNPVPGVMDGVPASRNYDGGFSCRLMAKDLGLALDAAEETGADAPLATQVLEMYSTLCNKGKEEKDFSSIFCYKYSGAPEK
eukprot:c22348_g1_i1 orf=365-1405(-)